jgi:hypothetical protein
MKTIFALVAICAFASLCAADSIGTYGDTTVVTGPDGNPAWQLSSTSTGLFGYSGVYLTVTSTLTPTLLNQLSADYVMETGTFGGGAPRFSLTDGSGNEAWIYWGTPTGGGSFSDPNSGNTTYANTGNYANLASPDVRVYSDDFGGDDNPNTGQTWAQFVAAAGSTQIDFVSLDLDGGFTGNQVMDTTNFDINGVVYAPSAVPEPGGLGLLLCAFAVLGGAGLISRIKTMRVPRSVNLIQH